MIFNALGLVYLRTVAHEPSQGFLLLLIAYSFSLPLYPFRKSENDFPDGFIKWKLHGLFLLWAFSLVGIYFLYFYFPTELSMPHLILAQSTIPLLSVLLLRIKKIQPNDPSKKPQESIWVILPLALLLILASQTWESLDSFKSFLFFLLCSFFLGAQVSIRSLAKARSSPWKAQGRLAIFVIVLLSICVGFQGRQIPSMKPGALIGQGAIMGVALLSIQGLYLIGIQKTAPLLSTLCIASSVPISIFLNAFANGHSVNPLNIAISIGYMATLYPAARAKSSG